MFQNRTESVHLLQTFCIPSHVSLLLIPLTQVFQACGKPRDGGTGVKEQLMIGQYALDNTFEHNSGKITKLVSIWLAHSVFL